MKRKNRKQKHEEYLKKYGEVPIDYRDRLAWLYDKLHITDKKAEEILNFRTQMYNFLYYRAYKVILFEEPEGTPRPRFRLVNRSNLVNEAMNNGQFVHVYSLNAKEDNMFMKRLITNEEYYELNNIIYTPCDVEYFTYFKTPGYYNANDTILAEIGLERPLQKPDWDNVGKKYSDMYNGNVWIDDTCVVRGVVDRYYSVLPRIEINLYYLNGLYNIHQARSTVRKTDLSLDDVIYFKGEK